MSAQWCFLKSTMLGCWGELRRCPLAETKKGIRFPFSQKQGASIPVQSGNCSHRKKIRIWVRKISYARQRPERDYVFAKYSIQKQQHKTNLGIRLINKETHLFVGYMVMYCVGESYF